MKHLVAAALITLMMTALQAQKKPMDKYTAAWKEVETLVEKKNLPESALRETKKIYGWAKKEGNEPQELKALVYMQTLSRTNTEDGDVSGILMLQKELRTATGNKKSLLHSILASAYWQYLQENRWSLYDRSQTIEKSGDIRTWTIKDLHDEIGLNFLKSISNKKALQSVRVSAYDPLIIKGNQRRLRPVLYDLLAQAALKYFSDNERDLTSYAGSFLIDDPAAFAPAATFSTHRFDLSDESSLKAKAVSIYQELIRMHLADKDPSALMDIDLQRLAFMHAQSVTEDKDEQYDQALTQVVKSHSKHPGMGQATFMLASRKWARVNDNNGGIRKDLPANTIPEIKNTCLDIIGKFPGSEGARNCERLLAEVDAQRLSLQAESVNIPGEPFRLLVQFRNIKHLHYRIINIPDSFREKHNDRSHDKYWEELRKQKFTREVSQPLPVTADMKMHSVELPIEALPAGHYAILASTEKTFLPKQHPLSVIYLHVSVLSWIHRGQDYFVLNRSTGKPISSAKVDVWTSSYDYNDRQNRTELLQTLKTDLDGYFRMPNAPYRYGGMMVEVKLGSDSLRLEEPGYRTHSDNQHWINEPYEYEKHHRRLFLFTDRSIYRPGQSVHVKGILVTRDFDTKRPKVITDRQVSIILANVNGEEKGTLDAQTGEYGTFSGSFLLPENGLTGQFTIRERDQYAGATIQVEEYKRPNFYVEWEKPTEEFRVSDTVIVKGSAMAYAGSSTNGAKVSYRVTRVARFPYPWRFYGYDMPEGRDMDITHGETRTSTDGSFSMRFKAIPDKSIDRSTLPIFDYKIIADVTDINGETRSAEQIVSIGYHSLDLSLQVAEKQDFPNDRDMPVMISAKNISGVPQTITANIGLYPLGGPERLIRTRYWEAADTFVLSEKEYLSLFPMDEFAQETRHENWKKGDVVMRKADTIKGAGHQLNIPTKNLRAGWYRLIAEARDASGEMVTTQADFLVADSKTGVSDKYGYFSYNLMKNPAEPGEEASLQVSTGADDLWVIQLLDGYNDAKVPEAYRKKNVKPQAIVAYPDPVHPFRFITLNRESKKFNFPVGDKDRGGFGVSHAFVKHNRFFAQHDVQQVPWSDKALDIRFLTYRDKTEPGSKEQWTIQVKGPKGDKVAAEVLMSMYDGSLDQFMPHAWSKPDLFERYPTRFDLYQFKPWSSSNGFSMQEAENIDVAKKELPPFLKNFDMLLWEKDSRQIRVGYGRNSAKIMAMPVMADSAVMMEKAQMVAMPPAENADQNAMNEPVTVDKTNIKEKPTPAETSVQVRKDFRETAFFLPDMKTDAEGNVSFNFTMPDAVTQWKWQVLAHTKDLATGLQTKQVVSQKQLMVQPNAPRFLREGDQIVIPARISNLSDKEISGEAELQLFDAETDSPVDGYFNNIFAKQYFTAAAKQGTAVNFSITVPGNFSKPIRYRIIAKAGAYSDGEEKTIPVLSNRMLVTESMPFQMKGNGTKTFRFEKLLQSDESTSLTHHRLTVEYSANPAWYAVLSLPYLTAYPYDCAEQSMNKFYANALAAKIAGSTPKIKAYYERWATDTAKGKNQALTGNLSKNKELRDILLEETPWVLDAKDEDRQRRDIAALFDMSRLSKDLDMSFERFRRAQSPNGGFVWFPGGPEDRYMTQYILTSLGRLQKAEAIPEQLKEGVNGIVTNGLDYLKKRMKEDHDRLIGTKADMTREQIGSLQIQCLYTFSCFPDVQVDDAYRPAFEFYRKQAAQFWAHQPNLLQGMTAMLLYRGGDKKTATAIIRSLQERAVKNETLGMYWKTNAPRWYWMDAPVETQSMLIEAFSEVASDDASVSLMKQWLLTQKQTNRWESTRATADACHALLMKGTDWLNVERVAAITVGTTNPVTFSSADGEAGTGYVRSVIDGDRLGPDKGNIKINISSPGTKESGSISWGAAYWQYFEHMDRITASASPLSIVKRILRERNTDKGPVLEAVNEGESFRVGDKLIVRIELRSDRDMEYVHLKDMRASGTEPVNVLSGYRWKGALGYYESTRDAATNFFFNAVPKGTHVFEYPLFVSHEGRFSVGLATVECMYAPEFRAHSEGMSIRGKQ